MKEKDQQQVGEHRGHHDESTNGRWVVKEKSSWENRRLNKYSYLWIQSACG